MLSIQNKKLNIISVSNMVDSHKLLIMKFIPEEHFKEYLKADQ